MARWRHAVELALTDEEIKSLGAIARSRSDPARRVERARMLLVYRENFSFFAAGQRLGVHHQTVERCVERAVAYGPLAALDDRPRPGKEPTITLEAKTWLVSLACDKAKEHGYPNLINGPCSGRTGTYSPSPEGELYSFQTEVILACDGFRGWKLQPHLNQARLLSVLRTGWALRDHAVSRVYQGSPQRGGQPARCLVHCAMVGGG